MTPRVSFITPSYNQGRFIERTVRSVLDQELPSFEYLVMDGGSTDETLEVLRRFHGHLRWVSEKDNGQTHAINKALAATSGDIIAWINSDDIYYPGAVQAACRFLDDHPEVDVVYGDANYIDEMDNVTQPYPTQAWDLERFKQCCYISQPAAFFRRRVVERFGSLNEQLQFCMDYEYWLRLARDGARFAYLKHVLAGTRMYPTNKTLGCKEKIHVEVLDTLKRLFGEVPDQWLLNYSHMVVGKKGVNGINPFSFSLGIAWIAYGAALQWNGSVSEALQQRLGKAEAGLNDALKSIDTLKTQLWHSESDRAARLDKINTLTALLQHVDHDRAARVQTVRGLIAMLKQADIDRGNRLELVERFELFTEGLHQDKREYLQAQRQPTPISAALPYSLLKTKIRQSMQAAVPPESVVLVISKGDDDLLNLNGCRGWHFPQTRTGRYAGHHPADSQEAIGHLEELRRKGAHYLLIPDTARWWLNHYTDFGARLGSQYRRVWNDESCVIYDIVNGADSN